MIRIDKPAAVIVSAIVVVTAVATASAKPKSPGRFVSDAIAGDIAGIELGRLAQSNSQAAEVKSFGQLLIDDHTATRKQLTELAEKMKVRAPLTAKREWQRAVRKLQALRDAEFDRAFLRIMVDDNRKDVREFQEFADESKSEAAEVVRMQLPAMRKRLQTAEQLVAKPSEGAGDGTSGTAGTGAGATDSLSDVR